MNWMPDGVPNQNDDVVINIDTTVNINSDVTIGTSGSVTLTNNADLRIAQSGKTLTIQGSFTINDVDSDLIAREGTILIDCTGIVSLDQGQLTAQGEGTGGIIVNHGTVTGTLPGDTSVPPNSLLFNIVVQSGGLVQNGGTLPSTILIQPGGTFETISSICPNGGNGGIGGKLLPIDTTALLLAGMQTNLAWIIPVIVSAVGFGIVILRKL